MNCKLQSTVNGQQRGAVLFVALVFLVLLTLLGLTAAGTSVLQERMTGGLRNSQMAMMGTESALRQGEVTLWSAPQLSNGALAFPPCAQTGVQPCYYARTAGIIDERVTEFRSSRAWLGNADGAAVDAGVYTGLSGIEATANLASDPRYMIEDMGAASKVNQIGNAGGAIVPESPLTGEIHLYRITARSQGGNAGSMRVTESVFGATAPAAFNPVAP